MLLVHPGECGTIRVGGTQALDQLICDVGCCHTARESYGDSSTADKGDLLCVLMVPRVWGEGDFCRFGYSDLIISSFDLHTVCSTRYRIFFSKKHVKSLSSSESKEKSEARKRGSTAALAHRHG